MMQLTDDIAEPIDGIQMSIRRKSSRLSGRRTAVLDQLAPITSIDCTSRSSRHDLRTRRLAADIEIVSEPCTLSPSSRPVASVNVVTGFTNASMHNSHGRYGCTRLKQLATSRLVDTLSNLRICQTASPFGRRVTCLCWVPNCPQKLAVGCKAGQIYVWNLHDESNSKFVNRVDYGPGYGIFAMKFHRRNSEWLYVGSGDGSLTREDMETHARVTYMSSGNWVTWCCSLDTSPDAKLLLSGDNKGYVTIRTDDGKEVRHLKLHHNKVTHLEFHEGSNGTEWLFATSSTDRNVKLWDVRKLSGSVDVLHTFEHDTGVNNVTFNPRDGTKMLTTDQCGEIRVYSGPLWTLDHVIKHPHRQYQHLTPIKASWHPLDDVVVIGRYPDPKFPNYVENEPRTIDFYGASGDELLRLSDWDMKGIASLNHFNLMGDTMASAMGYNILIWKSKKLLEDADGDDNDVHPSECAGSANENRIADDEDGDDNDDETRRQRTSYSTRSSTRKISSAMEVGKILRRGRK